MLPITEWTPLGSRWAEVNTLWRLGLVQQAWDTWLSLRDPRAPLPPEEQLVEGRLRLSVDDPWRGLDQLWRLNVRWVPPSCEQQRLLHRSQNPVFFQEAIQSASARHGVNPALLLAVAKQESRFSPGVRSIAGAIGLMQLMPATASSIAGEPLDEPELMQPSTNIDLGAAYMITASALGRRCLPQRCQLQRRSRHGELLASTKQRSIDRALGGADSLRGDALLHQESSRQCAELFRR